MISLSSWRSDGASREDQKIIYYTIATVVSFLGGGTTGNTFGFIGMFILLFSLFIAYDIWMEKARQERIDAAMAEHKERVKRIYGE